MSCLILRRNPTQLSDHNIKRMEEILIFIIKIIGICEAGKISNKLILNYLQIYLH